MKFCWRIEFIGNLLVRHVTRVSSIARLVTSTRPILFKVSLHLMRTNPHNALDLISLTEQQDGEVADGLLLCRHIVPALWYHVIRYRSRCQVDPHAVSVFLVDNVIIFIVKVCVLCVTRLEPEVTTVADRCN